ncbi:uncharacterized protein HGUI_01857 [Hanseniaspora guilliermondii]|uniref:Uncharacterized protein n=1 Tax=Hanseniaspora guilliermondii TaxID=56406 RepID=A0A1L0CMM7_9ASCO|nr:uncharacterized protein HGUI_01857 [Hanseniaspora guilliermondii]
MSDVASQRQSLDPDFRYDVKLKEDEYINNPGKDRFIVDDNQYIVNSDAPGGSDSHRTTEKMKLGTLSQRSFPLVPSVSSKSYKEVDYNAFDGWRNTQPNSTASKNIYHPNTNDLLATSNVATQPYTDQKESRFLGSQLSTYSLGRDLLIKQLINTTITNKMKQEDISTENKNIFTQVLDKYKKKQATLIPDNNDEILAIEECMHKWKIFSPEPLNDYNQNLLGEVKKIIQQMKESIRDLNLALSNEAELFNNLEYQLPTAKDINLDEGVENYKINFLNHKAQIVQDISKSISMQLKIIGNSVEKNNDELLLLSKVFEDTKILLENKLRKVKIFKNKNNGNLTGAEFAKLYLEDK